MNKFEGAGGWGIYIYIMLSSSSSTKLIILKRGRDSWLLLNRQLNTS